jgi:hypothetical protein
MRISPFTTAVSQSPGIWGVKSHTCVIVEFFKDWALQEDEKNNETKRDENTILSFVSMINAPKLIVVSLRRNTVTTN